jgi:hypothetical protein
MPNPTIIKISGKYVRRWLLLGVIASLIVPLGLTAFMVHFGFDTFLTIGLTGAMLVSVIIPIQTYRRGIKQSIELHQNRMVFDYLTDKLEYRFESLDEWRLGKNGKNWRLVTLKEGSSKLIPISAFPELLTKTRAFYGSHA